MPSTDEYQRIEIDLLKVEALVTFLVNISKGPREAVALLHAAIEAVDIMNANLNDEAPRSAEELGQELTTGLLLAQGRLQ